MTDSPLVPYKTSNLRHVQHNCDLTITAKDSLKDNVMKCHAIIAASNSVYVEKNIRKSLNNGEDVSIYVDGVIETLSIIVEYFYTRKLCFSIDQVKSVFLMATQLQIDHVIQHCLTAIQRTISLTNFSDYLAFSEKFKLDNLKNLVYEFLKNKFQLFCQRTHEKHLDYETLMYLISCNDIKVVNEDDVLEIVRHWIIAQADSDITDDTTLCEQYMKLLDHVKFQHCSDKAIYTFLCGCTGPLVKLESFINRKCLLQSYYWKSRPCGNQNCVSKVVNDTVEMRRYDKVNKQA